jgi:hypothetical protein
MLGRRSDPAPKSVLAQADRSQTDPIARRLAPRAAEAGEIAAAPRSQAPAPGRVVTRSTAPPPGAVLPSGPIARPPEPANPEAPDLAPIPPLEAPRAAAGPSRQENPLGPIRSLVEEAKTQLAPLRNYSVQMSRQERVGDKLEPEENVLLSIRRDPKAVRLEWTEGPNAGREVIYAAAPNGGLMHIRMPNNPLMPRLSMPPDSPLALRTSRHPITEAGLDAIVARLDETVQLHESGRSPGERLTYEGLRTPVPGGPPCHVIQRVTAEGETWVVALDAQTHLPFLVQDTAPDGSLLERYIFRDPQTDVPDLMAAAAFDPDARWGPSKGLLGRLARTAADDASTATR